MNPLKPLSHAKKTTEASLQKFGKRIRKNLDQGQKDYKSGKLGYAAINPFKK